MNLSTKAEARTPSPAQAVSASPQAQPPPKSGSLSIMNLGSTRPLGGADPSKAILPSDGLLLIGPTKCGKSYLASKLWPGKSLVIDTQNGYARLSANVLDVLSISRGSWTCNAPLTARTSAKSLPVPASSPMPAGAPSLTGLGESASVPSSADANSQPSASDNVNGGGIEISQIRALIGLPQTGYVPPLGVLRATLVYLKATRPDIRCLVIDVLTDVVAWVEEEVRRDANVRSVTEIPYNKGVSRVNETMQSIISEFRDVCPFFVLVAHNELAGDDAGTTYQSIAVPKKLKGWLPAKFDHVMTVIRDKGGKYWGTFAGYEVKDDNDKVQAVVAGSRCPDLTGRMFELDKDHPWARIQSAVASPVGMFS